MKNIERWFLSLFSSVDNTILGFFTKIGPYITAAIPALLAGYGIASYFDSDFGMLVGFVVGVGMEAAGIKIIHTAIQYNDEHPKQWDSKFVLLILASILFVVLVSGTIYTSDQAYPQMVRLIGAISPTLAAMAYFALGVERSIEREHKIKAVETQAKSEFEAEKWKLKLEAERRKLETEQMRLDDQAAYDHAQAEQRLAELELETKRKAAEIELATRQAEAEAEHQRNLEAERLAQKQERWLKKQEKQETTSSAVPSGGAKKPFKRFDEFEEIYSKTQDVQDIAEQMAIKPVTVRAYIRKFKAYIEQSPPDASFNDIVRYEAEQIINGQL